MDRILVTGGAGYLGSVLVRELMKKEFIVRVIDTGLYGFDSLEGIRDHPNFESFLQKDIRDLTEMSKALENVDHVVHLAGLVGMEASKIDPVETAEINYIATRTLAELCELRNINLIFASTCSVYGAQPGSVLDEKSKADPQEAYAAYKLKCEKAILQEHSSPCILRFGTLFGASRRMRFDLVINKFIAQTLNKEKIVVYGGGQQMRPFLHVKDAAAGIIFSILNLLDGVYNLLSFNSSLKSAAMEISKMGHGSYELIQENQDNRDYTVSSHKLNRMGFSPKNNIPFAYNEIADLFDQEKIDFRKPIYSNVDFLKSK